MSNLNHQFKKINQPTDVLAFNLAENKKNKYYEGEIYIDLQIAKRQAIEYKVEYKEEVVRLCIHGFLHILGYDDQNAVSKNKMWQIQERYLKRL
jgi:probable rRNA maturation factor